jgi:hypothetical protein
LWHAEVARFQEPCINYIPEITERLLEGGKSSTLSGKSEATNILHQHGSRAEPLDLIEEKPNSSVVSRSSVGTAPSTQRRPALTGRPTHQKGRSLRKPGQASAEYQLLSNDDGVRMVRGKGVRRISACVYRPHRLDACSSKSRA